MEEFIKENFNKMSKKEIANKLNISYNKLDWIIRKLNLRHYKSTKYSEQEDQLNQKVKEAASTLHSQNETVNCLFTDLVVSMEYPF